MRLAAQARTVHRICRDCLDPGAIDGSLLVDRWLEATAKGVDLLTNFPDISIGGARDIRSGSRARREGESPASAGG
ncbi:MAG: hypothetical protein R2848_18330 [Thermomicrobiales bacterium]